MKTFAELELIQPLQDAIADQGYETPTPIQARTIIPAMEGRDVLGCAQTGTGKTAAFSLPMLSRLGQQNRKSKPGKPFGLILAPTRELAIQIEESLNTYGANLRLRTALVYGGVGQGKQVRQLQRGSHLLVATPGRLLDLMDQGHLSLSRLEMFVLDEADRMLDMGFLPALRRIIRELPEDRQSLFFSATMPPGILELANSLLHDPVRVALAPKRPTVEKIEQLLLFTQRSEKPDLLADLLKAPDVSRAVVFTRTKRGADAVARRLVKRGIPSIAIHGNKSQNSRQRSLEGFRKNRYQVLVATDVAARGIDIDGVTHVVNYDLPEEPESYVHRIGRTGRAGADGIALSLCTETEMDILRAIEKLIGMAIPVHEDFPPRENHLSAGPKRGSKGRSKAGGRSRAGGRTTKKSGRKPAKSEASRGSNSKRRSSDGATPKSDSQSRRGGTAREVRGEGKASHAPRSVNESSSESTAKRKKKQSGKPAAKDSSSRGKQPTKSKRRSTKKKHKVKGSTSNSRTSPAPISKNAQGRKKSSKSAAKKGASGGRQGARSDGAGKKSTSRTRSNSASNSKRSKPKSSRTEKRRPKK